MGCVWSSTLGIPSISPCFQHITHTHTHTHAHTHTHTHTQTHTHNTASCVVWLDGRQAAVTFTSSSDGNSAAHVTVNTPYTYAIHSNPVDYTLNPSIRCISDYTGGNLTQTLSFNHDAADRTVPLAITELAFRSIAVHNSSGHVQTCGTILPTTTLLDAVALKAVFTSVVAGTVYLAEIRGECIDSASYLPHTAEGCVRCVAVLALCRCGGTLD